MPAAAFLENFLDILSSNNLASSTQASKTTLGPSTDTLPCSLSFTASNGHRRAASCQAELDKVFSGSADFVVTHLPVPTECPAPLSSLFTPVFVSTLSFKVTGHVSHFSAPLHIMALAISAGRTS